VNFLYNQNIFSFENKNFGNVSGDWVHYFVNLGYEIEKFDSKNLSVGVLLPDDNLVAFLIGIGYLKRISEKNEMSTGFNLLQDIWSQLEVLRQGDMVVVKKDNKQINASFVEIRNEIFFYKQVEDKNQTIEGVMKTNPLNVEISIVSGKSFVPPKRNKFSTILDNNFIEANFGLDFSQLTSMGSSLLSYVGNLARFERQASERFEMGEDKVKLSFNDILLTKNSEVSEINLTNFLSDSSSDVNLKSNFCIFNTYKNLDHYLSFDSKKKVFLFSRNSRQVLSGISIFDEMWSIRKEDFTERFSNIIAPKYNIQFCVFEMENYA